MSAATLYITPTRRALLDAVQREEIRRTATGAYDYNATSHAQVTGQISKLARAELVWLDEDTRTWRLTRNGVIALSTRTPTTWPITPKEGA